MMRQSGMRWPGIGVAVFCFVAAMAGAAPAHAGFDEGMTYYKNGEYFRALSELRPEAENGNALAQVQVAGIYQYGLIGAANYGEALKWYRMAAAKGNADAYLGLGVMYELGQGVPKDKVESVKWLTLASERFAQGPDRNRIMSALETLKKQMSDDEIAQAQQMVGDWKAAQTAQP
jgi:TPR repeat protein